MKRLHRHQFEHYSNSTIKDDIGGTLPKEFVRVDSEFIAKYFDERSKPNSSYVSYADDLILECYNSKRRDENGKKVLPLQYFSVMLKATSAHTKNQNGAEQEILGSRLGNLFGVPTVYNVRVSRKVNNGSSTFVSDDFIMSLDFLKNGETFENLEDLVIDNFPRWDSKSLMATFDDGQTMDNWVGLIKKTLRKVLAKDIPMREKMIDDICGDFCIQLLFRNLIAGEQDIAPYNFGFVFDKDRRNVSLAPAFDFEYCSTCTYNMTALMECASHYFRYMHANYPEKLAAFMDNFKKVTRYANGELKDTNIKKCVGEAFDTVGNISDYTTRLMANVNRMQFVYDQLSQNWENEVDIAQLRHQYMNSEKWQLFL